MRVVRVGPNEDRPRSFWPNIPDPHLRLRRPVGSDVVGAPRLREILRDPSEELDVQMGQVFVLDLTSRVSVTGSNLFSGFLGRVLLELPSVHLHHTSPGRDRQSQIRVSTSLSRPRGWS